MHGAGVRANKGVQLSTQGRQSGQIGLSRQIQDVLRTRQGYNLIGVSLFARASRHHNARPQFSAHVPEPLGENGQGPAFQGHRWAFERVKAQQGTLAGQTGQ